ncbi:Flavoprotein transmembrane component [Ophiocordyceps sinensis CO18]|uniref:ferric-chelate reductase (NADPH) n=1 Tax=Ophiocordyceps sinensis (strain Co18 / CGMCC 3.14243) TaxID=911162 RepID=T5A6Q9_OPHSC|nr:Flavoprotein transmembrane component [Ophiocordyceps sinensis CO18]
MDMGHTHGAAGINSASNRAFARDYWYIAIGITGLVVAVRAVNYIGAVQRQKACGDPSVAHATCTRPDGRLEAILDDAYYWERIGYRNAWVSLMQLPLLYLLAIKCNPVGWLVGVGHERLNWLHRWVARTMLVTATVHGFHFWTEWARADFVAYELAIMPLVKYGIAAWAVLLWSVVVGFLPVRRLAYEAWLLQHIVSAVVMLWLLYKHVPASARYLLYMAISFLVFDRVARWLLLLWQNTRWPWSSSPSPPAATGFGHNMSMRAVGGTTTILTIRDVQFNWHAGQHVYLWVPRLGPLEAHPYTIACANELSDSPAGSHSVQLVVRAHGGFSKRILARAARHPERTLAAFLSGRELAASTRNCVSRLSDERAVHKGTGAQGIFLHVEEYAF